MKVIKTRPKIRLRLPRRTSPGERVRADILLDCRRAVEVGSVRATLEGWERAGAPGSAARHQRRLVHLVAVPHQGGTLPEGVTELRCAFDLPAELPPSYDGHHAHVAYSIAVEVAVPWWPDARACFELPVSHPPRKARGRGKSLHSTAPGGPSRDEPHVEFSLHETSLVPGDTLRGELALGNVAFNRYRRARLSLVGTERHVPDGGSAVAWRYQIEIDVSRAAEGEPLPFAMKLPEGLAPSFETALVALSWRFEIEIDCAWKRNLVAQVPMLILPPSSTLGSEPARRAVRAVGDPRVLGLWQKVASDHRMVLDASRRLVATVAGVDVAISREHRGGGGVFLRAELRYPRLRLELVGGRRGALWRVLGGPARLDDAPWDDEHFVSGREEAQVLAFVRALGPALTSFRLVEIDDEHMVVVRPGGGAAHTALDELARDTLELARRVEPARAAVPPPAVMAEALEPWRELGRRLGAPLEATAMAVTGALEGVPVEVETVWSGRDEPLFTRVAVDAGDEALAAFAWRAGEEPRVPDEWPPRARALAARVLDGARELRLAEGKLELCDPAPALRIEPIMARIEQLGELAGALRAQRGPYR